jgi:hypothetical protein
MKQVKTAINERQNKAFQKLLTATGMTEYEAVKKALVQQYPQIA